MLEIVSLNAFSFLSCKAFCLADSLVQFRKCTCSALVLRTCARGCRCLSMYVRHLPCFFGHSLQVKPRWSSTYLGEITLGQTLALSPRLTASQQSSMERMMHVFLEMCCQSAQISHTRWVPSGRFLWRCSEQPTTKQLSQNRLKLSFISVLQQPTAPATMSQDQGCTKR